MRHLRSFCAAVSIVMGCGGGPAPSVTEDEVDGRGPVDEITNHVTFHGRLLARDQANNSTPSDSDATVNDVTNSSFFLSSIQRHSMQIGAGLIPMKALQTDQLKGLLQYYNQELRSERMKAEIKEKASASLRRNGYNVLLVHAYDLNRRETSALLDLLKAKVFAHTQFLSLSFFCTLPADELALILASFDNLIGIEIPAEGFTETHRHMLNRNDLKYISIVGSSSSSMSTVPDRAAQTTPKSSPPGPLPFTLGSTD